VLPSNDKSILAISCLTYVFLTHFVLRDAEASISFLFSLLPNSFSTFFLFLPSIYGFYLLPLNFIILYNLMPESICLALPILF